MLSAFKFCKNLGDKMAGIRKKIGEILIEENLITEEQLFEALETQRLTGQKVGQILIDKGFIKEAVLKDRRIKYLGQIDPMKAKEWQNKADVLINPRMNNEEYTKYSFPSKTIEYLMTGKPVVAYKLDGMKDIYSDFLYVVPENEDSISGLKKMIEVALDDNEQAKKGKSLKFFYYAKENLNSDIITKSILEMCCQGD